MKSSHKANTDLYFIIQQLSSDKLFKLDRVARKKKHDFGSFQKWQIWPNFMVGYAILKDFHTCLARNSPVGNSTGDIMTIDQ